MPKYEVMVSVNRCNGYLVYGIEADDADGAGSRYYEGEYLREEMEDIEWNEAYGDQPSPIVEEVEEFGLDYRDSELARLQGMVQKVKTLAELRYAEAGRPCYEQKAVGAIWPKEILDIVGE